MDAPTDEAAAVETAAPVAAGPRSGGAEGDSSLAAAASLRRFQHGSEVLSVACAGGADQALSGGMDGIVRLWRFGQTQAEAHFAGLTGGAIQVALAERGGRFLMRDRQRVEVCDLETGEILATREGAALGYSAAALSPDGSRLATGDRAGQLCVSETGAAGAENCTNAHADGVLAVSFGASTDELWTAGVDGTVAVWDSRSLEERLRFDTFSSADAVATFAPQAGLVLMSGGRTPVVCLWQVATGTQKLCLGEGEVWVTSLTISPDGRRALSGQADGRAILWNLESGQEIGATPLGSPVHDVQFCGRQAIAGTESGELVAWAPDAS